MNQWGIWFTFFVPAFLGGIALGVSLMAALWLSAKGKKARRSLAKSCRRASSSTGFLKRCA